MTAAGVTQTSGGADIAASRPMESELGPLGDQGRVTGFFFSSVQNLDKHSGLVDDIRNAIMDYQVCMSKLFTSPYLTLC